MKNLSPKAHQTVSYLVAVAIVALVVFFASVAHAAFSDPHQETIKQLQEFYSEIEAEANEYKALADEYTMKYNQSLRKLQLINQAANNTRELVDMGK